MDGLVFARGLIIGFSIAAPVGPIGVLCIRRTLTQGAAYGLLSGLGAATADAVYGSVAAFGLTAVSDFLVAQQSWLRLVGGLFLCYLGIRTLLAGVADKGAVASNKGLFDSYASTFLLTITNPMTIISFAAVFAGLGLGSAAGDYLSAAVLVLGVFLGSSVWWLILSLGVSRLSGSFSPRSLVWVNRLSGLIILAFGIGALLTLI